MPGVKRRGAPLRNSRPAKKPRSRAVVPRGVPNVSSQVHSFARWFSATTIPGNVANAPWLGQVTYNLAQLPAATEFTNLYDQFMLTHVKMYVHLRRDPGAQTGAASTYPKLYVLRDYTDNTTPASLDELRQSAKCQVKVLTPNKQLTFNLKPAVQVMAYRSTTTTAYMPAWRKWIDTAYSDTPHYGLKLGIDDLTNTNFTVEIQYKYWFKCRNTK